MIKKILSTAAVLLMLVIPSSIANGQISISPKSKIAVKPHGGWEKIQINEYDVAIIWATDSPESYYIVDARTHLCFFVVATTNGISTTRAPCKPFVEKISKLEDKYDICE